eukprot:3109451-Pyramimonas_sp.AAC.1
MRNSSYAVQTGAALKAEDFLKHMASLVVQKSQGFTEGKVFVFDHQPQARPAGRSNVKGTDRQQRPTLRTRLA